MWKWVKHCFKNYAVFSGRAARPEYWWFYLFTLFVEIPISYLARSAPAVGNPLSWVWWALVIVPSLAVTSRRLHDTNHSFWWGSVPFLVLFPLLITELLIWLPKGYGLGMVFFPIFALAWIALIIRLIVLLCTRGSVGPNRYGGPAPGTAI